MSCQKNKMIKIFMLMSLLSLLCFTASAETLLPAEFHSAIDRSGYTGTMGMDFVITADGDRVIDALGFIDEGGDGLQEAHRVAIWKDFANKAKLAEVTVQSGTGSYLYNGFRYVAISGGPITLTTNKSYTIGGESTALDPFHGLGGASSNIYYLGANVEECRWGETWAKPTDGQGVDWTVGYSYGGPTMASLTTAHNPGPTSAVGTKVGILGASSTEVPLSWNTGRDPANLSQVDSDVTDHYLYIAPNGTSFGSPITLPVGTTTYLATLNQDTLYRWRVDESINGSAPGSGSTRTGQLWSFTTLDASNTAAVAVDPTVGYQVSEGFGTSTMHQWTSLWYDKWNSATLDGILDMFYTLNGNGLGASICRWFIPHGDNPTHDHMGIPACANASFEPEDGVFDWDGHECILWLAQGAASRGAKMCTYQMGPPYWLTISGCASGSVTGGSNIAAGDEARYAEHIVDTLVHFRDSWGIEFDYVTPMAEPEQDWWIEGGYQAGCHIEPGQAITILEKLEIELAANSLSTEMVAPEVWDPYFVAHRDAMLASSVDLPILSTHQYWTDNPGTMQEWYSKSLQYNKKLWQTEWGDWYNNGSPAQFPYVQAQLYAEKIHSAMTNLHPSVWFIWAPKLLVNEEPDLPTLEPRPAYWTVAHYSRHVRPGLQMVKSTGSLGDCKTTVWIDPVTGPNRALEIVTYNDSDDYIDVDYDLSSFTGASITAVRRSLLNAYSPEENYASISFNQISSGVFSLTLPQRAIVTISGQFSGIEEPDPPSVGDNYFTVSYTGTRNDYTGWVGYEFTPSENITIDGLGRSISTTMNSSHDVSIWKVSDQSVVASITVSPSSPVDALNFAYEELASQATLDSGITYRIASAEASGGDLWWDIYDGPISSHASNASILQGVYGTGSYPASVFGSADEGYVPPTFYYVGSVPDTDPPTPDPATWASAPAAVSDTEITMTATTGSDATGPVEYFFDETTEGPGATDSGWVTNPVYNDADLSPNTQYTYTIQMRDSVTPTPNVGTASAPANATTQAGCSATDMHIETVVCSEVNCGGPNRNGRATVTIYDDCGNPVVNALVDGTFGGAFSETINDVSTNSNGQAVFTTSGCERRPSFTFTVDDVTHGTLPYDPGDDVTDNCSG